MGSKVTIQDIAEALGLSRNTVSKAINGTGSISEATKKEIFKKASEMGYKQFGVQMQQQELKSYSNICEIALFTHSFVNTSHFGSRVIDAFQEKFSRYGCKISIFMIRDYEIEHNTFPANFDITKIDGILCLELFSESYSAFLCRQKKPLLFVDTAVNNHGLNLQADIIYMENKICSYLILKDLIEKGIKNISFVGDYNHCNSFNERFEAYKQALTDYNLLFDEKNCILDNDSSPYDDSDWLCEKIKAMKKIPEAFFCANDFIAIRILRALKQLNLSVPNDVKVFGFDNSQESIIVEPPLTTVNIPSTQMGSIAADLMLSRIQEPDLPFRTTYVKTDVVFRKSTEI